MVNVTPDKPWPPPQLNRSQMFERSTRVYKYSCGIFARFAVSELIEFHCKSCQLLASVSHNMKQIYIHTMNFIEIFVVGTHIPSNQFPHIACPNSVEAHFSVGWKFAEHLHMFWITFVQFCTNFYTYIWFDIVLLLNWLPFTHWSIPINFPS